MPGSDHGLMAAGRSEAVWRSQSASASMVARWKRESSSRRHCSRRPAGVNTSARHESVALSSSMTMPAWMVLPRPTPSAISTRMRPWRSMASAGSS